MNDVVELTKEQRLQAVLDCKKVARYYETVSGTYLVQVPGICPTEGTDWGGFTLTITATGKTLEEAKVALEDQCKIDCVPGFKIHAWKEAEYCPRVHSHHIGQTCGCCGQHG
jgi:hypothetical protein